MEQIVYKPIGIIHTPLKEPRGAPIQSAAARNIEGAVEIFPEYVEGLQDIEGFSHLVLVYHFHLSKGYSLKVKPYMDDRLRGLFVTRAPARPNSIGLSTVRLDRVGGNKLLIRDVDIVDGTPLLDIKPYVPQFDIREPVRIGWLENHVHKLRQTEDNGRFAG